MNQRKLGIALSYFNIALQVIIGFLYVPILLHFIGKSEYGLYQLMGSLIAYFSIMDFGLSAAVIRFYAQYRALKDSIGMENILAISIRGYGAVTVLALAIGLICYGFLDVIFAGSMTVSEVDEAKQIFLLLLLNIVITLSTMVFRSVINAHERFFFLKGMETIQLVLQPILVVLVLQRHPSAFSVAVVQTVLNLVLSGARVYYCFHDLHVKIHFHYWNHELFLRVQEIGSERFCCVIDRPGLLENKPDYSGNYQRDDSGGCILYCFPDLYELYGTVNSHFRCVSSSCYRHGGQKGAHQQPF